MAEPYASLPMYDLAAVRDATDAWWSGLARHFTAAGIDSVPDALTRPGGGTGHWCAPRLLFSQTCGYPLVTALAGKVAVVATPVYDAPGCEGPRYSSMVVVGADSTARELADLSGARCALSSAGSWSGHHALRVLAAPMCSAGPLFGEAVASGGHAASIAMVAAGEADLAAIDCVTFALMADHMPESIAGIRILCQTPSAPGLPYITALSGGETGLRRLRDGLLAALGDPALAASRKVLRIAGIEFLTPGDYQELVDLSDTATAAGLPPLI